MPWSEHRGLLLDVSRDGAGTATVRIAGEFDLLSAGSAQCAVTELGAEARRIILDLSRVTFCDLAGLEFLRTVREHAQAAGMELTLRHPSRPVRRILELTGALPCFGLDRSGAAGATAAPDPDVAAICRLVLQQALRVSGAGTGNVQLLDPQRQALTIAVARGFQRPFLDFFETVHDGESACGTALLEARPVWVEDVASSPVFAGTPARDVMLEAGAEAVASVPVTGGDGGVIAMISTHRAQPTHWDEQQREQLQSLAQAAGRLLSM